MSAIARFLVEFEPSPTASPWPTPAVPFPAPSGSLDDGGAIEDCGDDIFGMASGPDTGDLEQDDGFGVASAETAPAEPSVAEASAAEAVAAALATAEAGFSERIATLEQDHARARAEDRIRWA